MVIPELNLHALTQNKDDITKYYNVLISMAI